MSFNVGDRVRCVRLGYDGNPNYGVVGQVYTVSFVSPSGYSIRLREFAGFTLKASRFELVTQEDPIPQQNSVSFYTLVYKPYGSSLAETKGFETEELFNIFKGRVQQWGYTILAEKKIKLTNIGGQ